MSVIVSVIDKKGKESAPLGMGCFGGMAYKHKVERLFDVKFSDIDYICYKGSKTNPINISQSDIYIKAMSKELPTAKYVHYMPSDTLDFLNKGMQISVKVPSSVMIGLFEMYRHVFNAYLTTQHINYINGHTNNIIKSWYVAKFIHNAYVPAVNGVLQGSYQEEDTLPNYQMYANGFNLFTEEVLSKIKRLPAYEVDPDFNGIFKLFSSDKKLITSIPRGLDKYLIMSITNSRNNTSRNSDKEYAEQMKDKKYVPPEVLRKLIKFIGGEKFE
ncbi:MAG: hypothetical protein KAS32_28530 [Candidatus Peribacteraceae bacterium]|nr:hypothetical protein [Candidatus Peribacteraceae bacterium]